MNRSEVWSELESKIGYRFKDQRLLETALTHSSFANEHFAEKIESYERLEFLGDAVMGLEVAFLIFEIDPDLTEGQMTAVRSVLVRTEGLAETARKIDLGKHIRLGVGADRMDVRENNTMLEDVFESLMAAVFLDGGTEAVRKIVRTLFLPEIEEKLSSLPRKDLFTDYKSLLQSYLQQNGYADIRYDLLEESGPDHNKSFRVSVIYDGRVLGTGRGKTKKYAEKMAAKMALEESKCI
jgi:ribonuclease-3